LDERQMTMIELNDDRLTFSFPEIHEDASCAIGFQRTLRIPDDENDYPLPPGLGRFPLKHVDDFAPNVSETWLARGGVMLPMYQSEAMWLNFSSGAAEFTYPFAVKIATGKINAVTGAAEHGGIQLIAYPMKREAYEARRRRWEAEQTRVNGRAEDAAYCFARAPVYSDASLDMGLAPGEDPPTTPPASKEYAAAGLPWFEYYSEGKALPGSGVLAGLESVHTMGSGKGDVPLPENEPVTPEHIVHLRQGLQPGQVREGRF